MCDKNQIIWTCREFDTIEDALADMMMLKQENPYCVYFLTPLDEDTFNLWLDKGWNIHAANACTNVPLVYFSHAKMKVRGDLGKHLEYFFQNDSYFAETAREIKNKYPIENISAWTIYSTLLYDEFDVLIEIDESFKDIVHTLLERYNNCIGEKEWHLMYNYVLGSIVGYIPKQDSNGIHKEKLKKLYDFIELIKPYILKYNYSDLPIDMPRLTALRGDIFSLDESKYDAAVAFVHGGYNGFDCMLADSREKIAQSKIGYVIYRDYVHRGQPYRPFIADYRRFRNEQEAVDYVKKMIPEALDFALECGNRIAFHGLQIHGWDEETNEKLSVSVVRDWLDEHQQASVTMVDIRGCFGKYLAEID